MTISDDIADIYNHYADDMYNYALYLGFKDPDIVDAIHDVFYNLCKSEKKVKSIVNIKCYLLKSLRNRLIDITNSKKEEIGFNVYANFVTTIAEAKDTAETKLIEEEEENEIRQKIHDMLSLLSPRQREIVFLRFIQECDYEQIAEIMHIDYDNCRKLIYKAFSTLRSKYPGELLLVYLLLVYLLRVGNDNPL